MSGNSSKLMATKSSVLLIRFTTIASLLLCGSLFPTRTSAQLIELTSRSILDQTSGSQEPAVLDRDELDKESISPSDKQKSTDQSTKPIVAAQAPELSLPIAPHAEPIRLLPLGAREIGCQSAQRWKPAIGLKQRAQTIQRLYCEQDECKRQAAAGIALFLCLQAYHQEDLAAATAMRAYYTRIGIVEQTSFISTGKQAIGSQQNKQNKLMDGGLPAGVDLSSLDRQKFDLEDQQLQAGAQDDQLRRLLSSLTCIDYKSEEKVVEPLVVEHQVLDCDALVALALKNRYDLQSWRTLHSQINEESAPMFASIIATSVGSFGIPIPKVAGLKQLLCSSYDKALLASNLRQEVATIIATNEGYAQQLVVEKCSQLQLAYQRHQLQLQRVASWEHRLQQIEKLQTLGDARPAERATAESGLLKARSDEAARRLEAKLAEVSLAEVVGGLAGKCCRGEAWFPQP